MSQQQTVLRVQTNVASGIEYSGSTVLTLANPSNIIYTGSGTTISPYTGSTTGNTTWSLDLIVTGGTGTFYYTVNLASYVGSNVDFYQEYYCSFQVRKNNNTVKTGMGGFVEYGIPTINGTFLVNDGDTININSGIAIPSGSTFEFYLVPDNNVTTELYNYDTLDIYSDIPLKINYSFAEIQDIAKRNSNYTVGLKLPGTKKNNKFFETYYNVEANSLFFDVTRRVPAEALLDDEVYFRGYLKLNKVSVQNSLIEYDVTLYSTVADLYGKIGNNLLKDLNYNDIDWHFNHYFNVYNVASTWNYNTIQSGNIVPSLWVYPIVHNGYEYSGDTVNLSGGTTDQQTRLYTSTLANNYATYAAFTSAGGKEFRVNSPKNPILDNQLKPALNIYALIHLMFKTYGYSIKSEFFETPWFKLLYMYGYYSFDGTKFGYKTPVPQVITIDGVEVLLSQRFVSTTFDTTCGSPGDPTTTLAYDVYVVKKSTGIPCLCADEINVAIDFEFFPCFGSSSINTTYLTIPPNSTGVTYSWVYETYVDCGSGCPYVIEVNAPIGFNASQSNVGLSTLPLAYEPLPANTNVTFNEDDYVDFSLVVDTNIKQIDLLSSIAKKFNLIFYTNPDKSNEIIIEPYDYYIGSGNINDWTDKISFDKGFSVEPALNFIESEIILTDQEDGDEGNKTFKDRNKLIYGENRVYNTTDFKSQTKKIETIFSPEIIRKWDDNIGIPLGINYAGQSTTQTSGDTEKVIWKYTGIKSKPKLFFLNNNLSPFLDSVGESYNFSGTNINTIFFRIQPSDGINPLLNTYALGSFVNPVISHTMPMGNPDTNKINNDSICILFNSQQPDDIGLGIPTFNTFTTKDAYDLFYANRINNLIDKNTRFLSGQFNLSVNDIKNLQPKDLIKIQERYFYVNKIDNFDLINPQLTKVELIQTNNRFLISSYPTRYFKYQYCGDSNVYKFRTFFNPEDNINGYVWTGNEERSNSIRRTYYYWSILYDYFVGALGGNVSGYTSSYSYAPTSEVWAYTITEITEAEYNTNSYIYWYNDNNNLYFIDQISLVPTLDNIENAQNVWVFSNQVGVDKAFFNCAVDCSTFSGYCSTNGVTLSSAP
jgi:hypothetical protein